MTKIKRFIIWICKRFTHDQILQIIDELIIIVIDKNSDQEVKKIIKQIKAKKMTQYL